MEHTKGELFCEVDVDSGGDVDIYTNDEEAMELQQHWVAIAVNVGSPERALANAKRFVLAWNAYDDLVAACEAIVAADADDEFWMIEEALAKVNAALRKAKGEGDASG